MNITNHFDNFINNIFIDLNTSKDLKILMAVSGGIDSMVMATLMCKMKYKYNLNLGLIHINHNLRSDTILDKKLCKTFCLNNNIEYFERNLDPKNIQNESIEAWSRDKRYYYFKHIANKNGYDVIITGHHLDDQIETYFMKMKQTNDVIQLSGIRNKWDNIYRPLLSISKKEIKNYAIYNNVHWNEDSTNKDIRFKRNQVRHQILPKLFRKNPKIKNVIVNEVLKNKISAKSIKNRIKYLSENNFYSIINNRIYMDTSIFLKENDLIQKYLIKHCCKKFNGTDITLTNKHFKSFKKYLLLSKNNSRFHLSKDIIFYKTKMYLIIYEKQVFKHFKRKFNINKPIMEWNNGKFHINDNNNVNIQNNKNIYYLTNIDLKKGLYVRKWKNGDRIKINKNGNSKKITKLFNENKVLPFERKIHPIVIDSSDNILWIPELRHNVLNKKDKINQDYIKIIWYRNK